MTDRVLPPGVAAVVYLVVGVGKDGEQLVVDLGQTQPPPGGAKDGLGDELRIGLGAPRIVPGRHL